MRDTIDMAREAWIDVYGLGHDKAKFVEALKHFESIVRADEREEFQRWFDAVTAQHKQEVLAEREACAKVVEALEGCAQYFPHVPDIIRNRKNT